MSELFETGIVFMIVDELAAVKNVIKKLEGFDSGARSRVLGLVNRWNEEQNEAETNATQSANQEQGEKQ